MSISAIPGAVITAERTQTIATQSTPKTQFEQNHRRKFRFTLRSSLLWVCLLIALLLRIWLILRTHGVIDGDEAMVGIQAEHILRGERPLPLYFYGQPYMGSLEAYLTAILFKIAGPSVWALRAEPALLSLVVVWLTGKMAQALAHAAQLPGRATQLFMATAMLFAAVSPVYDTVLELHTLGGYIETFILMLFLLLSAFRLTQRWSEGASRKELALRWVGIGFIIGLGLWVDPLIASAIVTAALWIIGYCVREIVRHKSWQGMVVKRLPLALTAIPAFLLGASPAIWWGIEYHWANITYLLQIGNQPQNITFQQLYPTRIAVIRGMAWFYSTIMSPRLIGGALPGEDAVSSTLHATTTFTGLLCIFITLAVVMSSCIFRHQELSRIRQLATLPLLFAFCSAAIFCTSPIASAALLSPQHDLAGRYATPFMLVLPFFFATAITAVAMGTYVRGGKGGSKAVSIKVQVDGVGRHQSFLTGIRIVQSILFVLLLITVGMQATSYGMVDPAATFQSPSCPIAPANDDPIIAYLQQEHVHYAWAVPWIGNPIIFKTNDGIITADPRPIINFSGLTRINAYLQDVSLSSRPAILTFVQHNDPEPLLLEILHTRHITYRATYFPSEPGIDVLVVTGLSRSLSLYESKYLRNVFGNCI